MSYKPSAELDHLMDRLLGNEKKQFFNSVGSQLPHTIRFNSLRGETGRLKSFLEEQGFGLENFPGFEQIFRITYQPYPIGKSLSHFLGHFYVQDIASMLPPIVLRPEAGDLVLDMSAAPGSKTTQMAVMMQNEGLIIANDVVQKRLRALVNNLQRLGILNTAVMKNYGESYGKQYFETFDKILLDPACSGLGTLHKSPEVLSWWTPNHCTRLASGQRSMITSAVKALKAGGVLVYSTCTLTPEENEAVIDYALSNFPLELENIHLPQLNCRPGLTAFGDDHFHPTLEKSCRIYPFENQTEGFFVARLRKTAALEKTVHSREKKPVHQQFISDNTSPVKKYLDYLSDHFQIERSQFSRYRYFIGKSITAATPELADFIYRHRPVKTGLTIARPLTQIGKFTTEGIHLFGARAASNVVSLSHPGELEQFVNRENLESRAGVNGQTIVEYKGFPIGYALSEDGRLKSQFPKAEWPFRLVMD
ncbi:MAG: NOL1/NOP2/sun family putative RNA methylase [Calditrichia bacterium]